ncbi:MAG: AbrB/MazE/SpoVT family DNA-binding domain-containing protein [Desulfobacterales bacterium]
MKVGERGQITIPKRIRERYGFLPNIELDFIPDKDGVLIKKRSQKTSPVRKVFGILNRQQNTDDFIEAIRGR